MHGWVGLLVKGTLKVLTWHPLYEPFLDLTFRYGFTILWDFPLHNTCKKWWLWERSQGSQMCWDRNLFCFRPDTVHQTNGWRRRSMPKYGVLLVFWCGLLPALEAHKKLLKWPFRGFRGLERFRAGKRQAWTPIKSHGCGLLPALEAHKKPLKWPFRGFWSVLGLANGKLGRP